MPPGHDWFAVAHDPAIYISPIAEEISNGNDERIYAGLYTFEPQAAFQVVSFLHQMFPQQIPAPVSPEEHGKVNA